MKKKYIFGVGVILLFLVFGVLVGVSINRNTAPKQETSKADRDLAFGSFDYDEVYPVNPNDKVWETLETDEMKFEKTQIEPSIMNKMDTEALLEAVIRHPMIFTIENSGNRADGAMNFLGNLNAGKVLLEREDVKEEIIKEYLSLQVPEKTLNDYSKIHNSGESLDRTIEEQLKDKEFSENLDKDMDIYYRIHFLEGIILSYEIDPSLTVSEKIRLYNKSLQLNEEKEKSEIFSYSPEDDFTNHLLNDGDLKMYFILLEKKYMIGVGVIILLLVIGVIVGMKKNRNTIPKQEMEE